ncbi:MAG TPA: hypothetical protein VI583_15555 [Cyclobacteriaceae bacterium]|nr:hypothetical protein [Cyclobacteriaceae bacterium]
MSTQDIRDESLDALFSKASGSVEFKFDEKNWNNLEKRLDHMTLVSRIARLTLVEGMAIIIGIFSLTIFSGIWIHEEPLDVKENTPMQNSVIESMIKPESNESLPGNEAKIARVEEKQDDTSPVIINITASEAKPFELQEVHSIPADNRPSSAEEPGRIDEVAVLSSRGIFFLDPRPGIPELNSAQAIIYPEERAKRHADRRLFLNLTIGPDLSGVKVRGVGAGSFTGLGLEYHITGRISLMSGINLVTKKYGVSEGEYSIPDSSFVYYGRIPESIDISCQVLDIPLNLYFHIIQFPRGNISLGTGFSSYLMLSEEYNYAYGRNNSYNRSITVRNENQHYLGIMNFSMAYTGLIGNKWAWQIEPYYKLPVTDIAAAQVKLHSAGILLTLKYKIK